MTGSRQTSELLQLPVRLRGIRLGRPIDLLLDRSAWRALGFVVLCGDELQRFLPFAAAQPRADEIAVGSALTLLDDVAFYRSRSRSLRGLLGGEVASGGRAVGALRDLVLRRDGAVEALVAVAGGRERELAPAAATVSSRRASAA